MPFLMRVELPDVPGSLGRLATALGDAGGDIEAIEIVEHGPHGSAIDDVLLDAAPGVMPDSLVSACNALDGVRVLWISRYAAGANLFLDLEVVEELTQNPAAALTVLVDLLPVTFRADWGMRVRATDSGVEVVHGSTAAPETVDGTVDWFPLEHPARLAVPPEWERLSTMVAGVPLRGKDEIVIFGRRGGPEILDSELARLQHLSALAMSISRGL